MQNQRDRNTQTAMASCELMINQRQPAEAIERYAGAVYIQHNPMVADGKQGFLDYFFMDADWTGIDKSRLDEHGKIVEHRDVLQGNLDQSAHINTMF
jgi:predicted SnoaL-like aldol condensation-catalyzing enzyme